MWQSVVGELLLQVVAPRLRWHRALILCCVGGVSRGSRVCMALVLCGLREGAHV